MSLTGQRVRQKDPPPLRCREHLEYLTLQPCEACGRVPTKDYPNDAAHCRIGWHRMQEKPGDDKANPLCRNCHGTQTWSTMNEKAFWAMLGKDPFERAAYWWRARTGEWPVWWQADGTA